MRGAGGRRLFIYEIFRNRKMSIFGELCQLNSAVILIQNNVMPSGERSLTGQLLYIQHVDRHSAGLYQCSADNGVGQPDTKSITLTVLCNLRTFFN